MAGFGRDGIAEVAAQLRVRAVDRDLLQVEMAQRGLEGSAPLQVLVTARVQHDAGLGIVLRVDEDAFAQRHVRLGRSDRVEHATGVVVVEQSTGFVPAVGMPVVHQRPQRRRDVVATELLRSELEGSVALASAYRVADEDGSVRLAEAVGELDAGEAVCTEELIQIGPALGREVQQAPTEQIEFTVVDLLAPQLKVEVEAVPRRLGRVASVLATWLSAGVAWTRPLKRKQNATRRARMVLPLNGWIDKSSQRHHKYRSLDAAIL